MGNCRIAAEKATFVKRRVAILVFLTVLFGLQTGVRAESPSASAVAQRFQSSLIDVMKSAASVDVTERYKRLAPAVEQSFHMPLMTQISAGAYWGQATIDERKSLVAAFRRMSVATLATLFSGYSGETFHVTAEKPGPSKTTLVMTHLLKTDGEKINIAYVARRFKIGWRMIDVIVDSGISELKVRRSEYNQILKKGGIPALIQLLNGKADELMSQ